MRIRRTIARVIAVLAAAGLLAGCNGDPTPTDPTTSVTPTTAPTTQSPEDQAAAAAWDAYLRFLVVDDQLARKPDVAEAIKLAPTVATAPMDGYLVTGVQQYYIGKGRKKIGAVGVPTQTGVNVRSLSEVVLDVCIDNTGVDVVDKDGNSTIKKGHPVKVKVTMTVKKVKDTWLVSKQDGGTEAC